MGLQGIQINFASSYGVFLPAESYVVASSNVDSQDSEFQSNHKSHSIN